MGQTEEPHDLYKFFLSLCLTSSMYTHFLTHHIDIHQDTHTLRSIIMRFAFLTVLITTAFAAASNSSSFNLSVFSPGTVLEKATLYISEGKVYLSNSTDHDPLTGTILANGTLLLNNEVAVGVGKNYLSTEAHSSSFAIAEPWSISDKGFLKLYGEDFHSVPSGQDGVYVLGTINAAAGRDDVVVMGIKAVADNGAVLSSFTPANYEGSSSSVSLLATSQTLKTDGATSKNAGVALVGGGAAVGAIGFMAGLIF